MICFISSYFSRNHPSTIVNRPKLTTHDIFLNLPQSEEVARKLYN